MVKTLFLKSIFGGILVASTCFSESNQYQIQAGAAAVNITPPVGIWLDGWAARDKPSQSIADDLYAKALVLSDGNTKVAIITSDLLSTNTELVRRVRQEIHRRVGIPPSNILITASHTHFVPRYNLESKSEKSWSAVIRKARSAQQAQLEKERAYKQAYGELLIGKMAGAVQMADARLENAWIGAGKGDAGDLTFNRRVIKPDGSILMSWRLPEDTEGFTFGVIDPEVGVIRIENNEGNLIASVINFATHPACGMDQMYAISADYPGYATSVVEQIEGGICLFALGTAGDQVPIEREGRSRQQIGRALGAEALKVLQRMKTYNNFPLGVVREIIKLPAKKERVNSDSIEVEIQAIAIGDIVIVALPGEVFVELGLDLKKRAGITNVFIFELSNGGDVGYVLSRQDFEEGGYEAIAGVLGVDSGESIIEHAVVAVKKLHWCTSAPKLPRPPIPVSEFGTFSGKGFEIRKKEFKKK